MSAVRVLMDRRGRAPLTTSSRVRCQRLMREWQVGDDARRRRVQRVLTAAGVTIEERHTPPPVESLRAGRQDTDHAVHVRRE